VQDGVLPWPQAFQPAGGFADICGLAHLVLHTRAEAVSGWQHGAVQDRYPTVRQMTSLEAATASSPAAGDRAGRASKVLSVLSDLVR
jgi:hypothetical protein